MVNNNNNDDTAIFLVVVGMCAIFAVILAIHIVFLLNLSKCLQQVRPRNRDMEPGQVWLELIPIFGVVWKFIVINRVASSLKREYRDRRWSSRGEDFGQSIGMSYCICSVTSWIPYLGGLFGIGGLVCYIVYWVKIAGYRNELASESNSDYDGDDDDDDDDYDDYDERPRRRNRDDKRDGYERDERDRNRKRSDDDYDR